MQKKFVCTSKWFLFYKILVVIVFIKPFALFQFLNLFWLYCGSRNFFSLFESMKQTGETDQSSPSKSSGLWEVWL